MNRLRQVSESFSRWIDAVAATVHALLNRWSGERVVRITEGEQGVFALQAIGDAKDSDPARPADPHRRRRDRGKPVGGLEDLASRQPRRGRLAPRPVHIPAS